MKRYLRLKRKHNREIVEKCEGNVFIADHIRETIKQSTAIANETRVIYNPVDVNFDGEPITKEHPRFVTASSLVGQKGVDVAIRALGHLDEYPNAELVVFGDGSEREALESLAGSVAPGRVDFRGRVDLQEVYRTVAGATATIFPSTWEEPFGRVTVESMSLGTPVVGSDVGGISEVIENGETGILFPANDAEALAENLRTLCQKPEYAASLGTQAKKASQKFTRDEVASQYHSFYEDLL